MEMENERDESSELGNIITALRDLAWKDGVINSTNERAFNKDHLLNYLQTVLAGTVHTI